MSANYLQSGLQCREEIHLFRTGRNAEKWVLSTDILVLKLKAVVTDENEIEHWDKSFLIAPLEFS